jgi:hypothetical protein
MYDPYDFMKEHRGMVERVPLQVYIERSTARRLRHEAGRRRISQSELVRQFIARGLEEAVSGPGDSLDRIIGMAESRVGDVAARHDDYLADSYRDSHR